MKFLNQTVIAASIAAAFSSASSFVLAGEVIEAPGTTTISTAQTIGVVFDATCYEQAIIEQEGDAYILFSSYDVGSDVSVGRTVLSALSGQISADLRFDVTKRGLNGAVQEINLDASIDSASLTLYGASAASEGTAFVVADGYSSEDPNAIAWANSRSINVGYGSSEAGQSISTSKTAKGMNITEFSSSTTFEASSFNVTDSLGLSSVLEYAFHEARLDMSGVAEGFMLAFSNALAESEVSLKVRASYQKGSEIETVVIEDVIASVACGTNGEGYAGAYADAYFTY